MTMNRPQVSNMTTRQKVTGAIFVIILIFLIWQIWGMLRGESSSSSTTPAATSLNAAAPSAMLPQQITPQPAQLPKTPAVMTQREAELLKLQQETEAKYIAALNELQMLKVEREIAETNRAIASARLQTVTAQKGIVDLLTPPAPPPTPNYSQSLVTPTTGQTTTLPPPTLTQQPVQQAPQNVPPTAPDVNYIVISVTQLQHRWSAVLGFQGNLFSVHVGDFLPPDRSKVVSIDKSGVVLEKSGVRKKFSMVPII